MAQALMTIVLYKTDSMGLELCRNLVQKQLKGQIQLRKHDGTKFIIEFKMKWEKLEHE